MRDRKKEPGWRWRSSVPQQGTASVDRRGCELLGALANPRDRCPQGVSKVRHDLGGIDVVPANSVNEVSPRRGRKEYAGHSSEPAAQVGVDFFPCDRASGVLVEARKTPVKLGLLRLGQLHIRRGQAVPKLTDEVEPFFRGQAADVERCHVELIRSVYEGFATRKG